MTLETFFFALVPAYLALVAYGQVGSRKRGLTRATRAVAAALRVCLPPLAVFGALLATRDAFLIVGWGVVAAAMLIAGAIVAGLVEVIAPRVGA